MQDMERYEGETFQAPAMQGAAAEILGGAALQAVGELDAQIATARRYPRDIKAVIAKITNLATLDEEAAEECLYALVRGKKKNNRRGADTDDTENRPIEGPSIRLAEIAAQMYGNCRISARVVEVNRAEKYVEAEGIFHDLETNMASKATVRRRISTKSGGLFSDDMIIVTGNAACAIAKRNAVLAGIPRAIYRPAYNAARKQIAGSAETIVERWETAVKMFASWGVKAEQLLERLGVESSSDLTSDNIATLRALAGSIKREEVTIEEAFAPERQTKEVDKAYDPLAEAAGQKQGKLSDDDLERIYGEGKAAKAEGKPDENPYEGQAGEVWKNGYDADAEQSG